MVWEFKVKRVIKKYFMIEVNGSKLESGYFGAPSGFQRYCRCSLFSAVETTPIFYLQPMHVCVSVVLVEMW